MNDDDFARFREDFDVAVAVLSRDRAASLLKRTDRLASGYVLFHCGDGYDSREYHCVERVEVPAELHGRPVVANFALRTLDAQTVILLDDDISWVNWLGGERLFHLDRFGFLDMLCNLVVCSRDVKAGLFGINDVDIRKASPLLPFHTRAMIGGLVGVNGRGIWHDERQRIKADYDFALQHLKRDRLVWKDLRYFLSQDRNKLPGGNMPYRTAEREELEVANLRRWWGSDVIHWNPNARGSVTKKLGIRV